MALKRPLALLSLPSPLRHTTCLQCRTLHKLNAPSKPIPRPLPFVPDVPTFLTLIGRNMSKHEAKIPTWEALFTLSSEQLKESGLEPARARRYLLWWRERFRQGIYGMGGDLKHVKNGAAELRIVAIPREIREGEKEAPGLATLSQDAGYRKVISNVPPTELEDVKGAEAILTRLAPPPKVLPREVVRVKGTKIVRAYSISGTGVEGVKGRQGVAVLKVRDGLWEQKRGVKIDGGERRRAMVRAKRAAAERKNAR